MPDTIPYHPLSPPDDPTLFYGREDVIAFLRQHLVGGNNTEILVILGRTGIGKTSVLMHVPYIVDERYQPVYLDTDSLNSTHTYLQTLVHRILQRMELIGASTYRIPEMPSEDIPEVDLLEWFANEFLDVVLSAIQRTRFLLLLLDDFQQIFNAIDEKRLPPGFIDFLGEILEKYERLSIVASLKMEDEDRALRHYPTANLTYYFRLQHLETSAARQLITEPVSFKYQFTEEALTRILHLCGGYPFLLHSVCRLLYRYHRNNSSVNPIGVGAIDVIYTAVLEETGEVIREFWQHTTPAQQVTILALLEFYQQNPTCAVSFDELKQWMLELRTGVNPTQLAATLRSLEYGLVVKTNSQGEYQFATALEADWLLANTPLKKAVEDKKMKRSARLIGVAAVIGVVIIIILILASGIFDSNDSAAPRRDAPPTSTLSIEIDPTNTARTATPASD